MPIVKNRSPRKKILGALVTAPLFVLLCGCSETPKIARPVYSSVPAIFLQATPAPAVPDENTVTDNELGYFMQDQAQALAACNADKADIAKLVNAAP